MVMNTEITLSWEHSIRMNISKDSAAPVFKAGQYLLNYIVSNYETVTFNEQVLPTIYSKTLIAQFKKIKLH